MVPALLLLVLAQPMTPAQCADAVADQLFERVVLLASEENEPLQRALESAKDPVAKVAEAAKAEAARRCAAPPPVVAQWSAWSEDGDFPQQAKVDAWLDAGAKAVVDTFTAPERQLQALGGDALCERAMGAVGPGLKMVSEPIGDTGHAAWAAWREVDVVWFFATACKADRVHATHRAALLCYARLTSRGLRLLERMDDCDLEMEPGLDGWLDPVMTRFEQQLERGARPPRR